VHVARGPRAADPLLEIARGQFPRIGHINKFGHNSDVDTGTDPEDLWPANAAGGNWVAPTAARIHDLASTSALDNGVTPNTGARTVLVTGLKDDWTEVTETITLNGVGNRPTSNSYWRIYRMEVLTAGSTGANQGVITATAQTDGTVTALIDVGDNQTTMAIWTTEIEHIGFLTGYYMSLNRQGGAGNFADMRLLTREATGPGPWLTKHIISVGAQGSSYISHKWVPYLRVPAQYDVKLEITEVSSDNSDVSGGFDAYILHPEQFQHG
jgi:hypothetical protein